MTMRYLRGRKYFDIAVMERETPRPGPNMALVKTAACGVCGSDLHLLANMAEYTPLGHELCGEVTAVGPGVTNVKTGDRVVVEDNALCGMCESCKNGVSYHCSRMHTLDGQSGMGEYLCVHESMLNRCEGLSDIQAALVEPLAVCVNTVRIARLPMRGNVAILGTGALAILCAALAGHFGAARVACVGFRAGSERNKKRAAVARDMGADEVFYTAEANSAARLRDFMGGGADAVLVTSPPSTLPYAMEIAGYGADIVNIGLALGPGSAVSLDIDKLVLNKNSIKTLLAEPARSFPLSIALLKSGVIDAEKLVTHTVPYRDTEQLKRLFTEDHPVVKAVVTFDD